jgi:hypothetical protein
MRFILGSTIIGASLATLPSCSMTFYPLNGSAVREEMECLDPSETLPGVDPKFIGETKLVYGSNNFSAICYFAGSVAVYGTYTMDELVGSKGKKYSRTEVGTAMKDQKVKTVLRNHCDQVAAKFENVVSVEDDEQGDIYGDDDGEVGFGAIGEHDANDIIDLMGF